MSLNTKVTFCSTWVISHCIVLSNTSILTNKSRQKGQLILEVMKIICA